MNWARRILHSIGQFSAAVQIRVLHLVAIFVLRMHMLFLKGAAPLNELDSTQSFIVPLPVGELPLTGFLCVILRLS